MNIYKQKYTENDYSRKSKNLRKIDDRITIYKNENYYL